MAYKNKIYVALDYDEDSRYYNLMKAWKQFDGSEFPFYDAHVINNIKRDSCEETIKRRLRERLDNSKMFILLNGEKTRFKHKYVRWEIEQALKRDLPIIVLNLNGKQQIDYNLCPAILHKELALHLNFKKDYIALFIKKWQEQHYIKKCYFIKKPMSSSDVDL